VSLVEKIKLQRLTRAGKFISDAEFALGWQGYRLRLKNGC
jgi:hypothetical protein